LWEQGRYDDAELASMRALHTSKQAAIMITTKAFDVCGARSAFKTLPLERALRDVRTFTLHFRESQVLRLLADADLGGPFHSKQKYGPKLARQALKSLRVPT
jgi:alkylation response protein AidB-like acyl-CoA dehydrogenase